ncbi:hypothetical protein AB1L07_02320 [Niallia alba]|uniref:hypothetical protein n=1 Tax=Niallia alba TaxID=2729105 RepID=UPI0039A1D3B2
MNINELIAFYGKYIKWYHNDISYKYNVGDLVKITENIEIDLGYKGQLGIIQGYSGVENQVSVMAYDTRAKRYWVCGFNEDELITPTVYDLGNYRELVNEFVDWTYRNDIKLSTKHFDYALEEHKKGNDVLL